MNDGKRVGDMTGPSIKPLLIDLEEQWLSTTAVIEQLEKEIDVKL